MAKLDDSRDKSRDKSSSRSSKSSSPSKTTYQDVYSDIAEQQRQVEQAKRQLQGSVAQRIAQREAAMKSPAYRQQYQERTSALSDIREAEGSLGEQLETIKKYEKKGYKVKDTDKGYQFSKTTGRRSSGGTSYAGYDEKYKKLTNLINSLRKLKSRAQSEGMKAAIQKQIDVAVKARKKYVTPSRAKKTVTTYDTLSDFAERFKTPISSNDRINESRARMGEGLSKVVSRYEPSAETRLIASGASRDYYSNVGEITVPDYEGEYGISVPGKTFKYGEDPYEKIIEHYETLPKVYASKLESFGEKASKFVDLSPIITKLQPQSRLGQYFSDVEEMIPDMPDFYKSKEGKDVLGMEPAYKNIMRQLITNKITEEKAKEKLSEEFDKKLSSATLANQQAWLGVDYNPSTQEFYGQSKEIFLKPSLEQDIFKYTEKYKLMTDVSKSKPSGLAIPATKISVQSKAEDAKKWLKEHETPEEYTARIAAQSGSFVDWEKYVELHPDKRALVLKINEEGEDLSTIFKPELSFKKAEKSEFYDELGGKVTASDIIGGMALASPLVYAVGSIAQGKPMTFGQTSKSFLVGATYFPSTLWTAASATPPAVESGDYLKEYQSQIYPTLYGGGYRLSEGARAYHRTGNILSYATEVATTPAMTDVVYPLAIGAAFQSASPLLSKAGGTIAKGGSRLTTKVSSVITKKLPTLSAKISKAGLKGSLGKVGSGTGRLLGRTVGTPYGITTAFMAPSAAEMGMTTAQYQKGELDRGQWIQSLQRGARTGFQLGMFSAGATYKPSGTLSRVKTNIQSLRTKYGNIISDMERTGQTTRFLKPKSVQRFADWARETDTSRNLLMSRFGSQNRIYGLKAKIGSSAFVKERSSFDALSNFRSFGKRLSQRLQPRYIKSISPYKYFRRYLVKQKGYNYMGGQEYSYRGDDVFGYISPEERIVAVSRSVPRTRVGAKLKFIKSKLKTKIPGAKQGWPTKSEVMRHELTHSLYPEYSEERILDINKILTENKAGIYSESRIPSFSHVTKRIKSNILNSKSFNRMIKTKGRISIRISELEKRMPYADEFLSQKAIDLKGKLITAKTRVSKIPTTLEAGLERIKSGYYGARARGFGYDTSGNVMDFYGQLKVPDKLKIAPSKLKSSFYKTRFEGFGVDTSGDVTGLFIKTGQKLKGKISSIRSPRQTISDWYMRVKRPGSMQIKTRISEPSVETRLKNIYRNLEGKTKTIPEMEYEKIISGGGKEFGATPIKDYYKPYRQSELTEFGVKIREGVPKYAEGGRLIKGMPKYEQTRFAGKLGEEGWISVGGEPRRITKKLMGNIYSSTDDAMKAIGAKQKDVKVAEELKDAFERYQKAKKSPKGYIEEDGLKYHADGTVTVVDTVPKVKKLTQTKLEKFGFTEKIKVPDKLLKPKPRKDIITEQIPQQWKGVYDVPYSQYHPIIKKSNFYLPIIQVKQDTRQSLANLQRQELVRDLAKEQERANIQAQYPLIRTDYMSDTDTITRQQQAQLQAQKLDTVLQQDLQLKLEQKQKFLPPILPDDKDEKKYYSQSKYKKGLGYKERYYKVQSFDLSRKPKYLRIVK